MLRLLLVAVVLSVPTACTPTPFVPTTSAVFASSSPTPFLPRGFNGVQASATPLHASEATPDESLSSSAEAALATTSPALDLTAVAESLNRLRANDGLPPMARVLALDAIARERAAQLAATHSLWHASEQGGRSAAEGKMAEAGFSGGVAELVLSVPLGAVDPNGIMLQAILTDPPNRALVFGAGFRFTGLGFAQDDTRSYIVQLLAEGGPGN